MFPPFEAGAQRRGASLPPVCVLAGRQRWHVRACMPELGRLAPPAVPGAEEPRPASHVCKPGEVEQDARYRGRQPGDPELEDSSGSEGEEVPDAGALEDSSDSGGWVDEWGCAGNCAGNWHRGEWIGPRDGHAQVKSSGADGPAGRCREPHIDVPSDQTTRRSSPVPRCTLLSQLAIAAPRQPCIGPPLLLYAPNGVTVALSLCPLEPTLTPGSACPPLPTRSQTSRLPLTSCRGASASGTRGRGRRSRTRRCSWRSLRSGRSCG